MKKAENPGILSSKEVNRNLVVVTQDSVRENLDSVVVMISSEKMILVVVVTSEMKTTAEETMAILITMISSKIPVIFWKTSMRQLRTLNLRGV